MLEKSFELRRACDAPQDAAALRGRHLLSEDFLTHAAKMRDPVAKSRSVLSFELAAQAAGERGTRPAGRDGDLKRTASHDGWIVKIAMRRIINGIAENSARARFAKNVSVHAGNIRCGYNKGNASQVARRKFAAMPAHSAGA